MPTANSYQDRLLNPVPRGAGAHSWVMSVANLAALSGQDASAAFASIRQVADPKVGDKEITEAIGKAYREHTGGTWTPTPRPTPAVNDGVATRGKIISRSKFTTEKELPPASPISFPDNPQEQQRLFLRTIFDAGDLVFIGDRTEAGTTRTIEPACFWIEHTSSKPFCIINPLSGYPAPKAEGGETYRGDKCIKTFRHVLVEFDSISIADQIAFWSAFPLPIKAIVHTGNKSLHVWLDVPALGYPITNLEQWRKYIKNDLYDAILRPLGVDASCSNPARLARLPGVYRQETGQYQRLLWLSPQGVSL
jgi:hypothetical protein